MADKKKQSSEGYRFFQSPKVEEAEKPAKKTTKQFYVLCPIHKKNIKIKMLDNRQIAICTCDVPENDYKGRAVWERNDTRRIL